MQFAVADAHRSLLPFGFRMLLCDATGVCVPMQMDVVEGELRIRSQRLAAELAECAARERELTAFLRAPTGSEPE